jgi:ATP-dependent DNA helicase RecG
MEWLDILRRVEAGESEHIEFKRGLGDLVSTGRAICAFANTDGGVIILGVDDSGTLVGVREDPEKVQERLTSFLQTGCSNPVSARLGRREDPKGWVHWIEVPRQRGYEPLRYDGRVWVRRGRSNVEPSPAELQELYNAFGYILTEERVIQAADPGDIDLQAFRAYLKALGLETEEEPQPAKEDDLRNRGALAEIGGEFHPTLYGVLAFGKEPQAYPQTANLWIQCSTYDGTDRAADVTLVGDAKGRLDEQVNRALGWVRGLGRLETYRGLVRTDTPLVPERALREAIVNAVAHRDYAITGSKIFLEVFSDRIDITSPGTLPNHMSVASVLAGGLPRSRNELMANYLLVMGLMEQRGRGWPIIRRVMKEFNNTDAQLTQDEGGKFVRVTLWLGPRSRDDSRQT